MIYNVGINTHVLLFAGSFNRKKIDLNQSAAFNYQGTGAVQWIVGFPLMLIPIGVFFVPYKLWGYEAGLAILIVIGATGIAMHQKLMKIITKKYLNSKHKMINAFEQNTQ